MPHDWMIHVLSDIREFAQQRAMYELAEHLDDAILIASGELQPIIADVEVTSKDDHQNERAMGTLGIVKHP